MNFISGPVMPRVLNWGLGESKVSDTSHPELGVGWASILTSIHHSPEMGVGWVYNL